MQATNILKHLANNPAQSMLTRPQDAGAPLPSIIKPHIQPKDIRNNMTNLINHPMDTVEVHVLLKGATASPRPNRDRSRNTKAEAIRNPMTITRRRRLTTIIMDMVRKRPKLTMMRHIIEPLKQNKLTR